MMASVTDIRASKSERVALYWCATTVIIICLTLGVIVVYGCVRFGSVRSAVAYLRGQRLIVDSQSRSAGALAIGDRRFVQFKLGNHSVHPVTVLGSRSSCTCLVAEDLPFAIPPSGTRQVRVRVHPVEGQGPFTQRVTLFTDCPGQAEVVLQISGSVAGDPGDPPMREME